MTVLAALALFAAPLFAATTTQPTPEGLRLRDDVYQRHLVYIIGTDGSVWPAKAPLKLSSRTVTFRDGRNEVLYSYKLADVDMAETVRVNTELIPRGLWLDDEMAKIRELELRPLSDEELERLIVGLEADVAESRENYRAAVVGAACSGQVGAAASLCAMNANATADRGIAVITAKAKAKVAGAP